MREARRIVFLFGSGISKPAGMPLGDEITQRVLSGQDAFHYNDDEYCFAPGCGPGKPRPNGSADEHVWRIVEFLRALKAVLQEPPRPAGSGTPNYEELFDAAVQVHAAVQCKDPVTSRWGGLAARLNADLADLWPRMSGELWDRGIEWLAQHVWTYIQCLVPHLLNRPPSRLGHLNWIGAACRDRDFAGMDLFTLNHDTVLEASLADLGGWATNGFDPGVNDLCHWNPALYDAPDKRVRLVKLHGSVNWFMFGPMHAQGLYHPFMAMPSKSGQRIWRGREGAEFVSESSRPVLLTGVETKINAYGNWLFEPLLRLFRNSLSASDDMLVCGYGFRDPGINKELANWLGASSGHRMVVIHGNPEELADVLSALGAIDKIMKVKKWVQEVRWPDIKREIWP